MRPPALIDMQICDAPWSFAPCMKRPPSPKNVLISHVHRSVSVAWTSHFLVWYFTPGALLWMRPYLQSNTMLWQYHTERFLVLLRVDAVYRKGGKKTLSRFFSFFVFFALYITPVALAVLSSNTSQRAGFYRQRSKIFMSAARAQLKWRIFCATIRKSGASLSRSSRLRSDVTLFSDDFPA